MYAEFSSHYDQFVDWEARLSIELPFIKTQLQEMRQNGDGKISILDAACGTGKHAIALVKAGFNCIGADFSKKMVEAARENAQEEGLSMIFRQAGFGELAQTFGENRFDSLICLGNSLPHLLEEVSLAKALVDFFAVLKPGGKLILQNRNFDLVLAERLRWMPPQTFREGDATWVFARFYDFDADGRLTFNIQILHSEGEAPFSQKVISTRLWPMKKVVLEEFLAKAGFNELQYYGDLTGEDFDPNNSGNLVLTAKT
jgi:glycine/sarcosine N-methyltransferase